MPATESRTFRVIELVEGSLRRRLSPRGLRLAYRAGYQVLRPWWFLTRPHTRGVKAVVRRGDRVLLVRHTYGRHAEWDLPGGFVLPDEEPETALLRELGEELGVRPVATRCIAETPHRHDYKREILFTYVADVDGDRVVPSVAEIADARWFPHGELPSEASAFARRMAARAFWPEYDGEAEASG